VTGQDGKGSTKVTTTKLAAKQNTNDPLVGLWFHSITTEEDGCALVKWQGQVVDRVHPNMYMLQLYEWGFGDPTSVTLVPAGDMAGWLFYPSAERMNDEYERTLKRRTERHLAHENGGKS
jgi:hypothetical protein